MDMPNIAGEIRKIIADKIEAGEPVRIPWITQIVLDEHHSIEGDDVSFYIICARAHVKEIVRACVGKYDQKSKSSDSQLVLAGFYHLQIAYSVERDGEPVLVPVDQLSDVELLERAADYDEMAKSCRAHAREIREYVEARATPDRLSA